MSDFGKALFSGSKFLFWAIVPLVSLFGLLLLNSLINFLITAQWHGALLVAILEGAFVLLGVSLWNPKRFWVASRVLTAIVFLVTLTFFLSQVLFGEKSLKSLTMWEIISGEPPADILRGFIFVGVPCLLYTGWGLWEFKEIKDMYLRKQINK